MNSSSSELLAACGEALFGPRWQSDMARLLSVNDRTVRYWVAGTSPVPAGVWRDITAALRAREKRAGELLLACAALEAGLPPVALS